MQEKREVENKVVHMQMRYTVTKLKSYDTEKYSSKTGWVFLLDDGTEMTFAEFEMMGYVLSATFPYTEDGESGMFFLWARIETEPQPYVVT